jgi:hypothetical protein
MSYTGYVIIRKGETVVLDLNGYTISAAHPANNKKFSLIINLGSLTIDDSSESQSGAIVVTSVEATSVSDSNVINNRGGTLILNGGTIEHQAPYSSYPTAIRHWANTTGDAFLTINGGTVKSGYMGVWLYTESPTAETNTAGTVHFTMTGGSVIASNADGETTYGIWLQDVHNRADSAATVSITGDAVVTGKYAYYSDYSSKVNDTMLSATISGGTFNGRIRAKASDIAITNGTFKEYGEEKISQFYKNLNNNH